MDIHIVLSTISEKKNFRSDLRRSKNVIENILGEECGVGHRALFSINKDTGWAFEVLRDEGFLYDSYFLYIIIVMVYPIRHDGPILIGQVN